jgi:hypothetical protein
MKEDEIGVACVGSSHARDEKRKQNFGTIAERKTQIKRLRYK